MRGLAFIRTREYENVDTRADADGGREGGGSFSSQFAVNIMKLSSFY
jgi:hypothetical protein